MMKQSILGIPDGMRIEEIPNEKLQYWDVSIQKHKADKAGLHYDFRLSDGSKAYSWAIRKGIPEPGEKRLAVEQPTHDPSYMSYAGTIQDGYGKGDVELSHLGKVRLIESTPNKVKFVMLSKRIPEELNLIRTNDNQWLMINSTPRKQNTSVPLFKKHYKEETNIDKSIYDNNKIFQPKVDGAHVIVDLKGEFPKIFSYRPSQYTDKLIQHTYRIRDIEKYKIPDSIKGKILRAELYGIKDGKAVPSRFLNSYLNSNNDKALEELNKSGVELRPMIFDINNSLPYKAKVDILKQVNKELPFLELPSMADTPQEKQKMLNSIRSGENAITNEGIVVWDKNKELPEKYKLKQDYDVVVREVFPMENHPELAGGFSYSYTHISPIVGKVGTGFTMEDRKELWKSKGKIAVIQAQEKLPSGALRGPSFQKWNLEKN